MDRYQVDRCEPFLGVSARSCIRARRRERGVCRGGRHWEDWSAPGALLALKVGKGPRAKECSTGGRQSQGDTVL